MPNETLRKIHMKIRHINDIAVNQFVTSTSGYDATGVQFGVMRNIPIDEPVTMSELTGRVHCVASNMTTIVQRMQKLELVRTLKSPADKRQTLVSLTPKGIAVRAEMEQAYQTFLYEMYGVLDKDEQETLFNLLAKIENSLYNK